MTPDPVLSEATRKALWRFAIFIVVLSLCFWKPISELVKRTFQAELYSHILLIPFISLYLGWLRRGCLATSSPLPSPPSEGGEGEEAGALKAAENVQRSTFNVQRSTHAHVSGAPTPVRNERGEGRGEGHPQRSTLSVGRWTFLIPFLTGLAALVGYGAARAKGVAFETDDYLALTIASFVCFIAAGGLVILGTPRVRALAFPMAFLVFMIPFPTALTHGIEMFFQHTTSDVTHLFFLLSGTPVLRDQTIFQLPGLVIRVAEECSGIRSSLVLFITSLVAGCLFLHSPWKRAILTLAVIPLGIVRNAIRVVTIAMLCLHVDPNAINSPIHHQGGPVFFVMSLVPFFLLLHWLRKRESRQFD